MLSQHVRKTGNPIRSLDLKLSCDKKVVPHGTRMRGRADRILTTQIGTKSHDCQVELHNSRSHADSAQPGNRTLDTRPSFVKESREGLGPRLSLNNIYELYLDSESAPSFFAVRMALLASGSELT